ncbi:ribosomal RNA small subunit methyltransferase A [Candidatus Falkowbacteria bacterium RIFOXYB2_FULL_34_18]|uniref:Ribosomal RNA small subunit methyltransferase A n=1 Tax=Candidatus Falkowbacteria bacterium RIFOXYD2_FULL_34_120 TaxID=1798007 RepID=A0A1F5TRQ4_9BACT|nr:MAG: ribosomal RNA small subunit methyltransferase A [Candidatus Falkowbacteria bacterium RIFOXYB2_FULL_34_18]OGF29993.1 MAG: ribosomal RNA small subunit methyltransferase A [Candidatus Falkowbacteria bacterium RIFOXYC12_FULL_34_55]OGF37150.1 MAG: ribosomal RNA small subunit methyltransferase A [Candidatus Falkowbacteria bacterium RIFOXYC2_FULL_34_220]OGF39529.1 MAG: ribosomal RNA small subunit methyltransferase A [Candidatus Falkowbacteria bacterium RIFOXYD12_FULL_34_57]OGF41488.1 MAG: ribo
MSILTKTKKLCQEYRIEPTRSRGQNFLIHEETYSQILGAADLNDGDVVLEVGPGLGFLTMELASRARKVIAVELDDRLAGVLKRRLREEGIDNVRVINKNVLDLTDEDLKKNGNYKIVANLPYNITSVFLRKFLNVKHKPEFMVLMLQKEVAERIVASPPKMSVLAISVQRYADARIIVERVEKDYFFPRPEVDSAIIRIDLKKSKITGVKSMEKEKEFFRLVKIGFSQKRKMLKNNLASGFHIDIIKAEEILEKIGLNKKVRAQELSINDWEAILKVLSIM